MTNLNEIVYLTAEQYDTLLSTGSITVGDVTHTYDENNIYCVKELDQSIKYVSQSLTDAQKAQARDNIGVPKGIPVATSIPNDGCLPNVFYKLGELTSDLSITLQAPTDLTISNEYRIRFSFGATVHNITFPSTVKWPKGFFPVYVANTTYEVNIEDGYAYIGEYVYE